MASQSGGVDSDADDYSWNETEDALDNMRKMEEEREEPRLLWKLRNHSTYVLFQAPNFVQTGISQSTRRPLETFSMVVHTPREVLKGRRLGEDAELTCTAYLSSELSRDLQLRQDNTSMHDDSTTDTVLVRGQRAIQRYGAYFLFHGLWVEEKFVDGETGKANISFELRLGDRGTITHSEEIVFWNRQHPVPCIVGTSQRIPPWRPYEGVKDQRRNLSREDFFKKLGDKGIDVEPTPEPPSHPDMVGTIPQVEVMDYGGRPEEGSGNTEHEEYVGG